MSAAQRAFERSLTAAAFISGGVSFVNSPPVVAQPAATVNAITAPPIRIPAAQDRSPRPAFKSQFIRTVPLCMVKRRLREDCQLREGLRTTTATTATALQSSIEAYRN